MDPSTFGVVHELAPVLAALFFLACPVGILWVVKHYRLKMKELEVEAQLAARSDARMDALEKRLTNIEGAIGLAAPPVLARGREEHAELMEAPATPAQSVRHR